MVFGLEELTKWEAGGRHRDCGGCDNENHHRGSPGAVGMGRKGRLPGRGALKEKLV
jgi:hypothetical protein